MEENQIHKMGAIRKLGNNVSVNKNIKKVVIESNKNRIFKDTEFFVGNAGTALLYFTYKR